MNEQIKISIILPVYNTKIEYLKRCVNSVLLQTHKNIELLIIDDGSNKDTSRQIDSFSSDNRVRIFHRENSGTSVSRNFGILQASGQYVSFIDHDDYIEENMYEKMLNAAINNNCDVVMCGFNYLDENGNNTSENIDNVFTNKIINNIEAMKHLYQPDRDYYCMVWNKLVKSEIMKQVTFPVGRLYEDDYATHQIFYLTKSVTIIDDKLYNYIQYNNSQFHSMNPIKKLDKLLLYFDRVELFDNVICDELKEANFENMLSAYVESKNEIANSEVNNDVKLIYKQFRNVFFKNKENRTFKNYIKFLFPKIYTKIK